MVSLQDLPVELIADILGELDVSSLVKVSQTSRLLRSVCSEPNLSPWRRAMRRTLRGPAGQYDPALQHLSVRAVVPRSDFIELFSRADARYLFNATWPNLRDREWKECFRRRFLPGWAKVKKDGMTWKEAFDEVIHRVRHRTRSSCTSDEAWTKYLVINRNGTVNQLESTSRTYNPLAIFEDLRMQNDLLNLQPCIKVVVEFPDVRILAIGVLHKPRTSFRTNPHARILLHPPGVDKAKAVVATDSDSASDVSDSSLDREVAQSPRRLVQREVNGKSKWFFPSECGPLEHLVPIPAFENYPYYTPSGNDLRWSIIGGVEEGGLQWIGSVMLTVQLVGAEREDPYTVVSRMQEAYLDGGRAHGSYASLTFADLHAVAPWLEFKELEGPGLGHDINDD
ncbi:hypothetical protein WOLCODRAFT_71219 [Wolfiporia cocos MD-104 SS10]|uniref:F-box domain-containing protein n=1 Tax=Wolfiporia cocos (strain MD-104) TaxID=742152 RepID=A0A2H3JXG3_WOLCO|nr:hypothetical protein WOLCODRAFT_71219 [Wolfiporia cocos MD-104 SS10]